MFVRFHKIKGKYNAAPSTGHFRIQNCAKKKDTKNVTLKNNKKIINQLT